MSLSPIATQINILQSALEEQQKYLRKRPLDSSLDEKCCNEMKKLQQLMFGQQKRSLNFVGLSQLYSILVDSEKSFDAGLQRIMGETFGSMLVNSHNGNPLWEVAKAAKDDIFRACLIEIVNEWAQMQTEGENRVEAKARILDFLENSNQTYLNLSGLALEDLPDIFHGEITKRLTNLDVSCNKLIILPESIGNLVALEDLDICNMSLRAIPETIKYLVKLKKLDIGGNPLVTLPEWIGNLVELEELDVSVTGITFLPDWIENLRNLKELSVAGNEELTILPDSIGNLSNLEELKISDNSLRAFPESMQYLHNLTNLSAGGNWLESVPDWIGTLSELEYLSLEGNPIVALPGSIGNLRKLKKLDLEENSLLASLPNSVLQLSNACELNIERCGFSLRFMDNLQAIVNAPGYSGPRISFSIQETDPYEAKTLEEALKDLSDVTDRQITFSGSLIGASQRSSLEIWLNRICEIADYKSSEGTKKQIASKVLDYLEETVRNEEFREMFYQVIADATRTCGDRVALSLLHIGLAYDESKIDLRDTQSLAQFLIRGVFVMSILEEVARAKIPTLRLVDEIEVYLGYPILLKERLQIPINVGEMLYAGCAGLTEQDLNSAETYVKEQIENKDTVYSFLVDQTKWLKALEVRFPEEITKLKEERMTRLEEDLSQVNKIEEDYKKGLIRLTNELIDWESLS